MKSKSHSPKSNQSDAPLLTDQAIFQLTPLHLRARVIADGVMSGVHRSSRLGSSSNFSEYKEYTPGDDLKRLDWKAYAKFDKYFIRKYEEATNLEVHLVVDTSASMSYAGGAKGTLHKSKSDYANTLAAGIAWIASEQKDGIGLSLFAGEVNAQMRPLSSKTHLRELISSLEDIRPDGPTIIHKAIQNLAERYNRRAVIIVISDFLDFDQSYFSLLGTLRAKGSDILLIQTMDPEELSFPFEGVVRFEDLESDRVVQVDAPTVKKGYLNELNNYLQSMQSSSRKRDLQYHLISTDENPIAVLNKVLNQHTEKERS
jgi:uncharacterized protein (DUF58 family)